MNTRVPGQIIKTARTLLNWGQQELADKAGCSITTLVTLEREKSFHHEATRMRIIAALEAAGVEFLEREGGKGMGVRYRSVETEVKLTTKNPKQKKANLPKS